MNFCPKCGTQVKVGTRFCPKCGFGLQAAATSTASEPVQATSHAINETTATAEPIGTRTNANEAAVDYQSNLGLVGATKQYFQNYVNFNGRMSRANFWWAYLGFLIIYLIAVLFGVAFGNNIVAELVALGCSLPTLTGEIRRLHDSNHSFKAFFWVLLPIVGWIYWIVLLCKPGDQQANRFG